MTITTTEQTTICPRCKQTPTPPNFMASRWNCWKCQCETDEDRYPVIVEYTHRHILWVSAEDQDTAVRDMQDEPYEHTKDGETLFEAGWSVKGPADKWDWQDVYEGGYNHAYGELDCNAHVVTRRDYLYRMGRLELEAWVENEDRDQAAGRLDAVDRRTCVVCPGWLVPGHAETPYHVNSQRMADNLARREAERAAEALTPA